MQLLEAPLRLLNLNVVNLLTHLRLLIGRQRGEYLLPKRASSLTIRCGADRVSLGELIEEILNLIVLLIGEIDPRKQLRPAAVDVAVDTGGGARLRLCFGRLVALLSAGPKRQRQDRQKKDCDKELHGVHSIGTARVGV